ncbi:MAG: glutamate--tRNA ligase family protein, partial [Candidatus Eremiobacterota bacterium]
MAPEPSGLCHLGIARVCLVNALVAFQARTPLEVRFEDTNRHTSFPECEQPFLDSLRWLGLSWQSVSRQGERVAEFARLARRLVEGGHAYYCFCGPQEWRTRVKPCPRGERVRYDRRCLDLRSGEVRRLLEQGRPACIRLLADAEEDEWSDRVRGRVRFGPDLFGDFVLLRSDGTPLYNFACAVDDRRVELVIRGEDQLPNTPRQRMVLRALGAVPPDYAHLPLLVDGHGVKLSKSAGAQALGDLRRQGILPEAVLIYLFRAGLSRCPLDELIQAVREGNLLETMSSLFEWDRVVRRPCRVSLEELGFVNRRVLAALPAPERASRAVAMGREKGLFEEVDPALAEGVCRALGGRSRDLVALAADLRAAVQGPLTSGPSLNQALLGRKSGPRRSEWEAALPREFLERCLARKPLAGLDSEALRLAQVRAYGGGGRVERLPSFRNLCFRVGDHIFKQGLGAPWPLVLEFRALKALEGTGLAPEGARLDLGRERFAAPVLCYRRVPGQVPRAVDGAALGKALARLHAVPPPAGIPRVRCHPRWLLHDAADGIYSFLGWRKSAGLPPEPALDRLADRVLRREQEWPGWSFEPALLHLDPRIGNLIDRSDGELTLVDWEQAGVGDPALDVAWAMTFNEVPRDPFWQAYGQPAVRRRAEVLERFTRLLWPIDSLNAAARLLDGEESVAPGLLDYLRAERTRLMSALGAGEGLLPELPEPEPGFVLAVEGPASSLKSEVASRVARLLGGVHLSAGLAFRALCLGRAVEYQPLERYPYARMTSGGRDLTERLYSHWLERAVARQAREPERIRAAGDILRR